jgi:hypothetical protein
MPRLAEHVGNIIVRLGAGSYVLSSMQPPNSAKELMVRFPASKLWALTIVVIGLTFESCSFPGRVTNASIPPVIVQKDHIWTYTERARLGN